MKITLPILVASLLAASHPFAAFGAGPASVPAPLQRDSALSLQPAALVAHAGQAAILGSTLAGSRIVAVGDHGVVLLSDDGGKSHRQAAHVPVDVTLTSVAFADARNGWAAGHWGVILHTTDGGEHWSIQRSDTGEDRPLFAVHFQSATKGVAVGLWSLILVTEDGGRTWRRVDIPPPAGTKRADVNLFSLFANASGNLFAAGERGLVLRSNDQGSTWSYLNTGYKGSLWTGACLPDGSLLVAGLRGSLFRSADDGASWMRIESGSKSSITSIAASTSAVLAVGADGLALQSVDQGRTFQLRNVPGRPMLTSVTFGPRNEPALYTKQGVAKDGIAIGATQ